MEIEKVVKTLTDAATNGLSVQRKQTRISYEELKKENVRLIKELEQVKRERDAAVEDIPRCCYYCAKQNVCDRPVVYDVSVCDDFRWRGVKE